MILVTVTDPKRKLRKLMMVLAVLLLIALLMPMLWNQAVDTVADAEQGSQSAAAGTLGAIHVDGQVWQLESFYWQDIETMRLQ